METAYRQLSSLPYFVKLVQRNVGVSAMGKIVYIRNRRFSNLLRHAIENWMPPVVRDSKFFYMILWLGFRENTRFFSQFRQKAALMTSKDFDEYYCRFHINELFTTDLNDLCTAEVLKAVQAFVWVRPFRFASRGASYAALA